MTAVVIAVELVARAALDVGRGELHALAGCQDRGRERGQREQR